MLYYIQFLVLNIVKELIMSLIKCIECGKEISDKSQICTNCGCPTSESIKEKELSFFEFKCRNCSGTKYTRIENQGGVFFICDKCGYVDEFISREKQTIQSSKPKCPTCGSTNIRRISGSKKAASIIGFGILSSNLGKTYECLNCKHKW